MKTIHLIFLENMPILEQLALEEALLRADKRDICLINSGSPPAIVMGISGKQDELLNPAKMQKSPIPLIRRFSGGGTVVVDESTLFVTFIFQKESHDFSLFPEPIYRWTSDFYKEAFQHPEFHLKENDYAIGEYKCGGNAQYLRKERFLHHTTFLWDFEEEKMDYLLLPSKRPAYRKDRPHSDFLCKLKDHFPSMHLLKERILKQLQSRFTVNLLKLQELQAVLTEEHRKTTSLI